MTPETNDTVAEVLRDLAWRLEQEHKHNSRLIAELAATQAQARIATKAHDQLQNWLVAIERRIKYEASLPPWDTVQSGVPEMIDQALRGAKCPTDLLA